MLASFMVMPHQGHLDAAFHMFAYLKSHDRSCIVFDPSYVNYEEGEYIECDWKDFYPDAKEALPPVFLELCGKPVQQTIFPDANHAGDQVTRRSRDGCVDVP